MRLSAHNKKFPFWSVLSPQQTCLHELHYDPHLSQNNHSLRSFLTRLMSVCWRVMHRWPHYREWVDLRVVLKSEYVHRLSCASGTLTERPTASSSTDILSILEILHGYPQARQFWIFGILLPCRIYSIYSFTPHLLECRCWKSLDHKAMAP